MPHNGTYEVYIDVYIDVRHYQRHLEDREQRESTAFKLVDTGNPHQMVLDALRGFADDLEQKWAKEGVEAERIRRRDEAKARWQERQ